MLPGMAGVIELYLNEMQHREGKVLITKTAVHHHLHECQEGTCQLSQSKHDLVGGHKGVSYSHSQRSVLSPDFSEIKNNDIVLKQGFSLEV